MGVLTSLLRTACPLVLSSRRYHTISLSLPHATSMVTNAAPRRSINASGDRVLTPRVYSDVDSVEEQVPHTKYVKYFHFSFLSFFK
jgi:hypothetical protein